MLAEDLTKQGINLENKGEQGINKLLLVSNKGEYAEAIKWQLVCCF